MPGCALAFSFHEVICKAFLFFELTEMYIILHCCVYCACASAHGSLTFFSSHCWLMSVDRSCFCFQVILLLDVVEVMGIKFQFVFQGILRATALPY